MPKFESNNLQNIKISQWLTYYLISAIPIIGLIFLVIWATNDRNPIRKNWAISTLIFALIISVIAIVLYFILLANIKNEMESLRF